LSAHAAVVILLIASVLHKYLALERDDCVNISDFITVKKTCLVSNLYSFKDRNSPHLTRRKQRLLLALRSHNFWTFRIRIAECLGRIPLYQKVYFSRTLA